MLARAIALLCAWFSLTGVARAAETPLTPDEQKEIAREAYLYLYPLVTMDVTRRQATNVGAGVQQGRGPANAFTHFATFPPAGFRDVVRPNFDTLYSIAWVDLRSGPMAVSVPDTGGRYYLLPMLDMWTDVFAAPGKRTTGTEPGTFALTPPGWNGELPATVSQIASPTPWVWVIGRTQTNGASDYDAVHKVQAAFRVTPLDEIGKDWKPRAVEVDLAVDMKTPPVHQVRAMRAPKYFAYGMELLNVNPPHATDQAILARMRRLGLEAGKSFDFAAADPAVQRALAQGAADGQRLMELKANSLSRSVNHWQIDTGTMGVWGNDYLKRAIVAMGGLGANPPEDSVYPRCDGDADGKPLDGSHKYVLHFAKADLPPVSAFWSLTLYDPEGFPVANQENRSAIGDRDSLNYAKDGSLDLYVQNASPGQDKEANWLPAPKGPFTLAMRLYAPKAEVLDGRWAPPPLKRAK